MFSAGQLALISIFSHLMFIYLTWKVITAIRIETIFKKRKICRSESFSFVYNDCYRNRSKQFFSSIY